MDTCPRTRLGSIDPPSKMRAKSKPPDGFGISPDIRKGRKRGKRFCKECGFTGEESVQNIRARGTLRRRAAVLRRKMRGSARSRDLAEVRETG